MDNYECVFGSDTLAPGSFLFFFLLPGHHKISKFALAAFSYDTLPPPGPEMTEEANYRMKILKP